MPPVKIVLSTPDGKTKPVSFKQAEKVFCGGFPIRDKYEPPEELANFTTQPSDGELRDDASPNAPRFNP